MVRSPSKPKYEKVAHVYCAFDAVESWRTGQPMIAFTMKVLLRNA